jgi:MauM/NapG family ferredoxin protein
MVSLKLVRRVVQAAVFVLFLVLLIQTVAPVESWVPPDFFLRLDPLAGVSSILASRSAAGFFPQFAPALLVIVLTVVLGRFFCGWICPLGTTIDIWDLILRRWRGPRSEPRVRHTVGLRNLKYYVLGAFVIAAVFSTQIAWLMDPIPIATRSYAVAVYPYLTYAAKSILDPLWQVPVVNRVSEPVYDFLKQYVLFPNPDIGYQQVIALHHIAFLFFAAILGLSLFHRRFWCRHLCPLGALLGLLSKVSFLRWVVDTGKCTECNQCVRECKTAAIAQGAAGYWPEECVECLTCQDVCPQRAIAFRLMPPGRRAQNQRQAVPGGLDLSRRRFLEAAAVAAVAVPLVKLKVSDRDFHPYLIRPPGALPEEEFLDRCIRCGECMKVCPTNGLQPTSFEAGLEGIGTPKLVPAMGYCDYECNACSEVCPTGAIKKLSLDEKKKTKIGTAYINKNKCYPWNENLDCLVCEEHCPTAEKSIKFWDTEVLEEETNRTIIVKRPYIVTETCIGCGICEEKCPLKDDPGVRVTARGEDRHPERYSGGRGV